jgi:ribosomal protein S18 acetylase RimI-like enzyme
VPMLRTDYTTRDAVEADAAVVASHRFHEPWGDETRVSALRAAYAEWLKKMVANGRYVGRLAEVNGCVIAGAGAVLLDWGATWVDPEPIKSRLVNVFTLPEHRRQGVAKRLVAETIQELRGRGVRSVTLASTETAQGLYTSLGFEPRPGEYRILLS